MLLKREVIATGDQLTNATTGQSQEGPAVNVQARCARRREHAAAPRGQNLNKRMAVVLIEKRRETTEVDGKKVAREVTDEEVINDATIRGVFSNNFQITGLQAGEARELALLLRSGSLATPIYPIEERAVGPSLGRDNIDKGVTALLVGMAGVFVFMAIYYKTFGLVADLVLLANVVLLTALLSMMRASLSLPGIAGIILTVGMAVDANVLIYERIREELRKGVSPQAAIRAGFEKAFSAIADSNVTDADRRGGAVGARHRPDPRLRHRADARHRDLDVHLADGQPRAAHAHVRRPAQARAAVDLTAAPARTTPWNFSATRPASRSWPRARCGTRCRRCS